MVQIYRADDPVSGRWSGNSGGIDLSAFQIDQNFYLALTRIATLESASGTNVSIAFITLGTDGFVFHMTDHTTQGPFVVPPAAFVYRGTWTPFTSYSVNDTFSINGSLDVVLFPHTSAATFVQGANDGLGHNYYSEMLAIPGSSLPTGGAAGMMLYKVDGHDFHTSWKYPVPAGGTAGQYLTKINSTDFNMQWSTLSTSIEQLSDVISVSPLLSGQVLEWNGSHWQNTTLSVTFSEISDVTLTSPASGDVLSFDGAQWVNTTPAASALHSLSDVTVTEGSGINGYTLNWNNGAGKWEAVAPVSGATTLAALTDMTFGTLRDGDEIRYDTGTSKWVNRGILENTMGSIGGITVGVNPDSNPIYTVTPTGNITWDNSSRHGKAGQMLVIAITTSGTSSFTMTFSGTDYVGQGNLATGTVTAKKFVISFMSGGDGKLYEINRLGPL